MRSILKAVAGMMLGLMTVLLFSGCAKPHFEVTYFAAASEYTLPGDVKIGRDGYVVIAAQYDATHYDNVYVLVSDIPQDEWWWKQISPVGFFQNYWFFMLPEQYADHAIKLEMANSQVKIESDMQLDRTGIGKSRDAGFLSVSAVEEWQKSDWNALVGLTVRVYANNPDGNSNFLGTVGWEGAGLAEEMNTFSKSQTLIIESTNSYDYRFDEDFSKRLADGDSDAMSLALDFFRDPRSPACIIYYNFRDVSSTYDVYINGVKTGQTTKTALNAYAEMNLYSPRDNRFDMVTNTDSYSFTKKELKAKLKELISQMQP